MRDKEKTKDRLDILTVDQVNERLPLVRRVVRDIQELMRTRKDEEERFASFRECLKRVNSNEVEETVQRIREELGSLDRDLETLKREISGLGGILKDCDRGCVDFFSQKSGRLVFLCWQPGEERVHFYHDLDADHDPDADLACVRRPIDTHHHDHPHD